MKDLVVLKRNDRKDANVIQDGDIPCLYDLYLTDNKELYFYHCGKEKWILSNLNGDQDYYNILKPIKEEVMKEYLFKYNDQYTLVELSKEDAESNPEQYIEVPEGATYYAIDSNLGIKKNYFFRCPNDAIWVDSQWMSASFSVARQTVLWQRHTQPEELPFMDSLNDQYAEIEQVRKHRHYFKDVSNIAEIDVYAVLKLFDVTDPCLQHIVKKALCAGKRGHKDMMEDLQNIVDTANRAVELNS